MNVLDIGKEQEKKKKNSEESFTLRKFPVPFLQRFDRPHAPRLNYRGSFPLRVDNFIHPPCLLPPTPAPLTGLPATLTFGVDFVKLPRTLGTYGATLLRTSLWGPHKVKARIKSSKVETSNARRPRLLF